MAEGEQIMLENYRLVTSLRQDNHSAFEELFRLYCRPLKAFAIEELKSEELAEDAVQEIFCKLWLHRHKLDPRRSVRGFLFTCLKNHILNVIRTRKNEILKNYRFAYGQSQPCNDTEQDVLTHEIQREVHQLINHLPEVKRRIVQLSLYQGWSHERIADELNVSINTVKMYLSQTSRQLRYCIEMHGVKIFIFFSLYLLL